MKVVIAVHHFPPRYTGGAEWETYRIASTLRARGHEVHVICVERIDAGQAEGVSWTDEIYNDLPVRRLSYNLAAAPDPVRWEYDNLWIGEHLERYLDEIQPDIFHLISGYLISGRALHVAHDLGIPSVVSLMDFWFLCRRISMLRSDGQVSPLPIRAADCARCLAEERRLYRWPATIAPALADIYWRGQREKIRPVEARAEFLRQALELADTIISRSHFVQSVFTQAGVGGDRFVFSRQGRDFPDMPDPVPAPPASPVLRVGYLGQIAWHKGVHVLFEAARQLPNAQMTVQAYGDLTPFPAYTARLRKLSAQDSRLELMGSRGQQDLGEVLRNLDVLVVPSLWYENSPNVMLEAFAHHTPVIASNLGGMTELVQDGTNGLLFAPGDAGSLARQLRRLLDEPALLPALRRANTAVRSVAEEIDELGAIYRRVVSARRPEPLIEA